VKSPNLLTLLIIANGNYNYKQVKTLMGESQAIAYLENLEKAGFLKGPHNAKACNPWTLTEKGRMFIRMLNDVPHPIPSWRDPSEL